MPTFVVFDEFVSGTFPALCSTMNQNRFLGLALPLLFAASCSTFARAQTPVGQTVLPADFCQLGENTGVDPNDAQVASGLVCEEVRRHPKVTAGRHYKVQISRLGRSIYLSLSAEEPAGVMLDKRQMQLAEIEEVPVVSNRLVRALLEGVSVDATQTVENVAGEETRTLKKKTGELLFGLGFVGAMISTSSAVEPGGILSLTYESGRIAVPLQWRFGGGESRGFTTFDLGIRYFFRDTDVTPLVGGGVGIGYLGKLGLNTFVEAGVEALRSHRFHVLASMRLDLPAYSAGAYAVAGSLNVQAMYRF